MLQESGLRALDQNAQSQESELHLQPAQQALEVGHACGRLVYMTA